MWSHRLIGSIFALAALAALAALGDLGELFALFYSNSNVRGPTARPIAATAAPIESGFGADDRR